MKPGLPFRNLTDPADKVAVRFGTTDLMLPVGENLAGALLVAGVMPFRRTPTTGAPRGPFCMMGACYDCLVEVGGVTRQACMMQVTDGMVIAMPHIEGGADD